MKLVLNNDAVVLLLVKGKQETFRKGENKMNYIRTPDNLVQQRLNQELVDVLMAISATTHSIARHLHVLSGQRKSKGVNHDKR